MSQIHADLACGLCGYNLRGLYRTSTCPECGTPILQAIRDHRLLEPELRFVTALAASAASVTTLPPILNSFHIEPLPALAITVLVPLSTGVLTFVIVRSSSLLSIAWLGIVLCAALLLLRS